MSAGTLCTRIVVFTAPSETIRDVARQMLDNNVGTVVVVDEDRHPMGILTDRDLVLRCVAQGRDPYGTTAAELMTTPVRTISESTPIDEALAIMRRVAARRLIVTDEHGALAGILALDDILDLLAEETSAIAGILGREAPSLAGVGTHHVAQERL